MSEKTEETDRIRISQVLAGALAAVTAALIGSTMGVAGTVVGAGVASVISTIGGTLYLKSIQRTRESVRTVHAKVVGRSGGATVLVTTDDPDPAPAPGEEVEAEAAESADEPVADDRPPTGRRRRWPVLVVTTIAAFALGMLAVTGVEWLRGESLSGDSGTTFGSIVAPRQSSGGNEDPADPTTTTDPTTTPPATSTEPTTTTPPTSTSTTTPPSESSTTTTTTTPPVTTTTEAVPSAGSAPASG
jgi:hypothetical protein